MSGPGIWDPSNPTNQVKIRKLGQDTFRAFWDAIEQASDGVTADSKLLQYGINLIDRNTIGGGVPATPEFIEKGSGDQAGVVYCKNDGAALELFFRNALDVAAPDDQYQLTRGTPVLTQVAGEAFIPGGLSIKWGRRDAGGTGVQDVRYVDEGAGNIITNFPTTTLNVWLQTFTTQGLAGRLAAVMSGSPFDETGFSYKMSQGDISIFWLAIGN